MTNKSPLVSLDYRKSLALGLHSTLLGDRELYALANILPGFTKNPEIPPPNIYLEEILKDFSVGTNKLVAFVLGEGEEADYLSSFCLHKGIDVKNYCIDSDGDGSFQKDVLVIPSKRQIEVYSKAPLKGNSSVCEVKSVSSEVFLTTFRY